MNTIKEMIKRPFTSFGISVIGVMTAMAIIVTRFLSYFPVQHIRVDPAGPAIIMMAGMFLGPIGGALVGGLSDIVGILIFNPTPGAWNPLIFSGQVAYGFVAGLLFMKKWNPKDSKSVFQIITTVASAQLVGSTLITLGVCFLYGLPFVGTFLTRLSMQPLFIGLYAMICILVVQPVESILPWSRK